MVTSDGEDEQLVRAFQRGDDAAFSVFVQRYQDRVYRLTTMWLIDSYPGLLNHRRTLLGVRMLTASLQLWPIGWNPAAARRYFPAS